MVGSLSFSRALPRRAGALLIAGSLAVVGILVSPVHAATTGAVQSYLVVYKSGVTSTDAAAQVQGAGGALVYNYQDIGVAVAKSDRSDFASNMQGSSNVDSVVATASGAARLRDQEPDAGAVDTSSASADPAAGVLAPLQWDMTQIHAFEAHAVTGGSRSVIVGDIDTGADPSHPDLAPNIDASQSVGCLGGVPNPTVAGWRDDNGHGTHTAGTIAASGNLTGVAPNVRLAIIKAGDSQGFFFPEAVVCAFHWAGTHHINVTNNSYFADPFYFNCKNDPAQFAIWKAEDRAIRFAMSNGTTVVAAEGNFADDLAHPTQDTQSPDNTTPVTRPVTNACVVVPVEIPGVIGVTADGNLRLKSFYSNYGDSVTQVTAPGGDSRLQRTAAAPNGRVLSTFPSYPVSIFCFRSVVVGTAHYCYLQGTSMASPHVAGVAALIESIGVTMPGAVQARVENTADNQSCPTAQQLALYAFFPSVNNGAPQACTGGTGYNSWFGHGQVNALAAVS
jgi:lantibiotic leader peptide-processing serine protease